MQRILFLHVSAILGGSERSFLDLVEKANIEQRKNILVVLPSEGPLKQALQQRTPEIAIIIIPIPKFFAKGSRKLPFLTLFIAALSLPFLFLYFRRLLKVISTFSPQVLYTNGLKCHFISMVLKKIIPITTIWHMQDFFPTVRYVKFFLQIIGTQPEMIICNSKSVQNSLEKSLPNSWTTKLTTVHNAVDLHQFFPRSASTKDLVTISMVAMITPWKGQDVFIEAIKELKQLNPHLNFQCQIIGDEAYQTYGEAGYKAKLINRVEELGLSQKIKFLGLIQEIELVYQDSDIVVHCSKSPEPFGRVIIEAMSSECAVIATKGGGVSEIISHELDGLLVPPNAPTELRKALEKLCTDKLFRQKISKAGRQTVERLFSADQFSKTIFSNIEKQNFI